MTDKKYKEISVGEFTKAAEVYETDKGGVYKMCKKDYPDVLAELEKEPFTDLLDCGCGPAPMLTLLHEKYPEKHYTGIDLTPKMIEVAKAKNMEGVELVVGDCENLPFAPESFDVDLPDSIAIRRKCFEERPREFLIEGDLLSENWTNGIPNDRVTIVIAEGLFMYFTGEQVKQILTRISGHFHKGYLLAELMHPFAAKNTEKHDTVKNTNAVFQWGIEDGHELEELCDDYQLLRETSFFEEMKKYTLAGKIGNVFFKKFNDRLAVYRFWE